MPLFSVYHGSNWQNTLLSTDCSAGVLNATLVDIANNNNNINNNTSINETNNTESTNNTIKPTFTKDKNDVTSPPPLSQQRVRYKHVELIPFSFLHELASNNKTVQLLHQIQRYRHQHGSSNTESRLSLSSLSGNLTNTYILNNNNTVSTSGNTESSTTSNSNPSTNSISNSINTTALQSLLHNIPFVGLMNAPVQLPVCELAGMSGLTSTVIPPNFNSIGIITTGTNLINVIGTNNFVLIGCREYNLCDELPHANTQTHTPSLLSSQQQEQQHQEEMMFSSAERYLHNIMNSNDANVEKANCEAILERARKISNKSIWQDVNKVAFINNKNDDNEGESKQVAHINYNNNNSNNKASNTSNTSNKTNNNTDNSKNNNNYIPNALTRATAQVALNSTLSASTTTSNASSGKGRSNSPSTTTNSSNTSSSNKNKDRNNNKDKQKGKNVHSGNSSNENDKVSISTSKQNTPREKNKMNKSPRGVDLSVLPEMSLSVQDVQNTWTNGKMNDITYEDKEQTTEKEEEKLEIAKRIKEYNEQHVKPVERIPVNVHAVHTIMANHSYNDDNNNNNVQYSPAKLVTRLLVDEVVQEEMQREKQKEKCEKESTKNSNSVDEVNELERANLAMQSEYMSDEINTNMFNQINTHDNNGNNSTTINNKSNLDNITKVKDVQVIYENTEIPLSHAAHSLLNASSNYTSNLSTSTILNNTSSTININNDTNCCNPFVVSLANCTVNVRNVPITNNINIYNNQSSDSFNRTNDDDNGNEENTEPWSHLLERMHSFDVIYKAGSGKESIRSSSKHEDELLSILLEEYLRLMKSKFDVARQQYRVMCEAASGHYSNHRHSNSNNSNNNNNKENALSKSRSKTKNDKATKKKK